MKQLGLAPMGIARYRTVAAGAVNQSAQVYDVSLVIANPTFPFTFPAVRVIAVDLPGSRYQCLLGRDLLARGRFVYDGPAGTFELAFRPGAAPARDQP